MFYLCVGQSTSVKVRGLLAGVSSPQCGFREWDSGFQPGNYLVTHGAVCRLQLNL